MRIVKSLLPALLLASLFSSLSYAVTPDRISGALTGSQTVPLRGNVHARALPEYDEGPADPALRLASMTILTVPSPNQRKALIDLLAQQQDPESPKYHQWLTPEQFAESFGLSQNDVKQIANWLQAQGFSRIRVSRGRNWVTFSGTAAQVQRAFGTEIHRFNVGGEVHVANATAPKIPAALAGVVTGIRGLNDFHLRPSGVSRVRPNYYSSVLQSQFAAPGDIATMYDINTLYQAATAIDGTGQKLAVIGQTDIYLSDLTDFRTGFGLSAISCTVSSDRITACSDPHLQYVLVPNAPDPLTPLANDLSEADLDLEWSGAVARGAQLVYVNAPAVFSGNNLVSGGVWDAWYYAVDNDLAPVITMSYGTCEFGDNNVLDPTTGLPAADEVELMKANVEGITFVNSSGDSGAASCDDNSTLTSTGLATQGLAVSYPASSPEVTGVGGTAIPLANISPTYWGTSNGTDGGSVLPNGPQNGYIPEEGWNDDVEIAQFCAQNSGNKFCTQGGSKAVSGWVPITSAATAQDDIGISATGGGPSNCAKQNTSFSQCVSGFPKPAWQTVTVPSQASARFSPDVSLPATPNFPGYIFCTQLSELKISGTGSSCAAGIANSVNSDFSLIGGTSASAPIFAGVVVLLNQYLGSSGLGNINPTLYKLALTPANGAFHPVTSNSNVVYCQGGTPSGQPVGLQCPSAGVNAGQIGFNASNADATTGYNLVTGLGSVDVDKLFVAWAAIRTGSSVVLGSAAATNPVTVSTVVTFTATVTPTAGVGTVTFSTSVSGGAATVLGTAVVNVPYPATTTGTAVLTTTLPAGSNSITATYEGDAADKSATSAAVAITVTQPDFSMVAAPTSTSVVAGHTSSAVTLTFAPTNGFNQPITPSCTGLPTGATCAFSPTPVVMDGTNIKSTSMTISTAASMAAATTSITISATGSGTTHTITPFPLTTSLTDQSFTIAAQNATYTVTRPQSANVTLTLTPTSGFNTAVTYTCTDPATESTCTGPAGPTTSLAPAFVITTTAPTRAMAVPFGRGTRIFYAALLPGLLGIMFTAGSRQRSLRGMRLLGLIILLGFSTLWLASCSGGNSTTHDPGTSTGPHTITINATTGGANPVTASTTFILQVN